MNCVSERDDSRFSFSVVRGQPSTVATLSDVFSQTEKLAINFHTFPSTNRVFRKTYLILSTCNNMLLLTSVPRAQIGTHPALFLLLNCTKA